MQFINYDDDQHLGKHLRAFGRKIKQTVTQAAAASSSQQQRGFQATCIVAQLAPCVPWVTSTVDLYMLAWKPIGLSWIGATPGSPGCQCLYLMIEQPFFFV